jgi:hypothetical protein
MAAKINVDNFRFTSEYKNPPNNPPAKKEAII